MGAGAGLAGCAHPVEQIAIEPEVAATPTEHKDVD
jgi:hypothetical protein